ncbi:MAG: TonB-dependent receptor plug domain-containing protein [Cryomorphaceae bacterium]|nr:TonB-dependent receptor plug domain-containing protein [Cryomorphaceae bacterium]
MRHCALLVLLSCFSFSAICQSQRCKLVDAQSGVPINEAHILIDAQLVAVSDVIGEFVISKAATKLTIEHLQYSTEIVYAPKGDVYIIALNQNTVDISGAAISAGIRQVNYTTNTLPGAVISQIDLNRDDRSSLQNALNTIPGVQYDARGLGGSRRISIRGSFIRSPFAVRNIKIYLDDMPLTSPDGQASLEILDPADLYAIEVIKGPAANAFGAGNGGVLIASTALPMIGKPSFSTETTVGSYGYFRSAANVTGGNDRVQVRFSNIYQQTDGYRDQESNFKSQQLLKVGFKVSERLQYDLISSYYNGAWDLPGAVSNYDEPTSSPEYTIINDTHVERKRSQTGFRQLFASRFVKNSTTLYYTNTSKINPFGTSPFFNGYKNEKASGGGMRTRFDIQIYDQKDIKLDLQVTGEYNGEENLLDEFELINGSAGEIKYSNITYSDEWLTGLSANVDFRNRLFVEVSSTYAGRGLSSRNKFKLTDLTIPISVDRTFIAFLPRAGVSVRYFNEHYLFGSIASGFSPPSLLEVIDPSTGVISETVEAEDALSMEAGIKGSNAFFGYQFSVYSQKLTNAIVPFTDSLGVVTFGNANGIIQQGVEGSFKFSLLSKPRGVVRIIQSAASGALQKFAYNRPNDVINENRLPGVPFATGSFTMDVTFGLGFSLRVQELYSDRMPVNDANSVFTNPYHLLNLRAQFDAGFLLPESWTVQVFGGVQNILNSEYSSFVSVNGAFGRYYNPAPTTNGYVGLNVGYRFQ